MDITKQEMMNNLTDQFREFISQLYDEDKELMSKKEIEDFQNDICDLIEDHGKNLQLVVKVKYRRGNMKSNLGENTNRKVRLLSNVLKKGVEIPSDATYFELKLLPAIIVKNTKKNKIEIKDIDIELQNITVYMGEASIKTGKVSTGKGEYYVLPDDATAFVWGKESFNTRMIKVNEVERTIEQ